MVEAIKFAHEHIKNQCDAQEKLAKAFGKKETREYEPEEEDEVYFDLRNIGTSNGKNGQLNEALTEPPFKKNLRNRLNDK